MERYISTTIVQLSTAILQERLLPINGKVVARVGQSVSPVQVVARAPYGMDFRILPVAQALGVPPAELEKHLAVKVGDSIEEGMVLAQKKGLRSREYTSPVEGKLYDVNAGRLVVRYMTGWLELRAMVEGRIARQIPNRGVVIELTGSRIQAVWSSGKETFGKLKTLARVGDAPFSIYQLNDDMAEHILVVGRIDNLEALEKAEEIGVRGLIAGSITANLISAVNKRPYAVIITDGIGGQPMAAPILQTLQQLEDRPASIFGKKDALGDGRPEIIVPNKTMASSETAVGAPQPVAVGQAVRILQPPYAGQIGEIVKLYQRVQSTAIGTRAHGVAVKLADGGLVFVPYANLDVII